MNIESIEEQRWRQNDRAEKICQFVYDLTMDFKKNKEGENGEKGNKEIPLH
jgi:hypothetical protein